jgi:hypothetical protein
MFAVPYAVLALVLLLAIPGGVLAYEWRSPRHTEVPEIHLDLLRAGPAVPTEVKPNVKSTAKRTTKVSSRAKQKTKRSARATQKAKRSFAPRATQRSRGASGGAAVAPPPPPVAQSSSPTPAAQPEGDDEDDDAVDDESDDDGDGES